MESSTTLHYHDISYSVSFPVVSIHLFYNPSIWSYWRESFNLQVLLNPFQPRGRNNRTNRTKKYNINIIYLRSFAIFAILVLNWMLCFNEKNNNHSRFNLVYTPTCSATHGEDTDNPTRSDTISSFTATKAIKYNTRFAILLYVSQFNIRVESHSYKVVRYRQAWFYSIL